MRRKLVLFDVFGVLIPESRITDTILPKLFPECPMAVIHKAYFSLEKHTIDSAQFWEMLGGDEPVAVHEEELFAYFQPDAQAEQVLRYLEQKYHIAILSNLPEPWIKHIQALFGQHTTAMLFSGQKTYKKPDTRIYMDILDMSGYHADETVFIDDRRRNLGPAADLGMKTIHLRKLEEPDIVYKPDVSINQLNDLIRIL
ncbi:MAG: HAD family hydrolase [Nanoarchaeota archaeon]